MEKKKIFECLFRSASPKTKDVPLFLNVSLELCYTNPFKNFQFSFPAPHPIGQCAVFTPVLSRFLVNPKMLAKIIAMETLKAYRLIAAKNNNCHKKSEDLTPMS